MPQPARQRPARPTARASANGLCVTAKRWKRPLPAPFDACDKQGTRVNSLSLVRYRTNDYSVPVAYGHREVWIRGYVHEVVIGCGAGIIARHPRSYDREDMVFDPIHYLPLLEHKIGALDQAAPLAGWELPDAFPTPRRSAGFWGATPPSFVTRPGPLARPSPRTRRHPPGRSSLVPILEITINPRADADTIAGRAIVKSGVRRVVHAAALLSSMSSMPSLNWTPSMTFARWRKPRSRRQYFSAHLPIL